MESQANRQLTWLSAPVGRPSLCVRLPRLTLEFYIGLSLQDNRSFEKVSPRFSRPGLGEEEAPSPSCLMSRQAMPTLDSKNAPASDLARSDYALADSVEENPELILICQISLTSSRPAEQHRN
jgi:hypothetical protein